MWFASNPQFYWELGDDTMVENALILIIKFLLFGLVTEAIIVFALILLVLKLSK